MGVNVMKFIYKDITINYDYYDNDSKNFLVFLHGWGQNIDMMFPLAKPFIKNHNCLIIDLPGFGLSDEPTEVWSIEDYTDCVHSLIKELKIKKPILIGHSFGGKISLMYAIKYDPKKIVLLASAYRQRIKKTTFKMKMFKFLIKIPGLRKFEKYIKKHVGSTDYRNASEKMRNILVKHVNFDLENEVNKIKCPSLLIWGTADNDVPYEDAILLEKLIPNAGLVTYEGCSHYAYLERLDQTKSVLKSFIEGGE